MIWSLASFKKNEVITNSGEIETGAYFVLDGVQRAYFTKNDVDYIVAFSFDGSFSGVIDSFFSQSPSHYILKTFTDSMMLKSSYKQIKNMSIKIPAFDHFMRESLNLFLSGRFKRERELLAFSAKERYDRFILESSIAVQKIPQKYIASYLNMSPETYSRLRKT